MVRVRYAPSPTGDFHVGGARTALFNWLFARKNNGQFILRIEDTDQTRFNPDSVSWLLDGLEYLGLNWDEGPSTEELNKLSVPKDKAEKFGKGGDVGPYTQSFRVDKYQKAVWHLIDNDYAYICFDDKQLYHWRTMPVAKAKSLVTPGRNYHVRLKLPRSGNIIVKDFLRGDIEFKWAKLKDPVILKTDGIPTYHLASVVDDLDMNISHVIRGAEWLSSFPLHWFLYECFMSQSKRPIFIHLPLILNPTGKGKMSKREARSPDGTVIPVFVRQYKELGFLPDAMFNFLAMLGWTPGAHYNGQEIFNRNQLIDLFNVERLNRTAAAWDIRRLRHFNQAYIKNLTEDEFALLCLDFLGKDI